MKIALDIGGALAGPSGIQLYIEQLIAALARVDKDNHYFLYAAFWKNKSRLANLRLPQAPNFHPVFKRFPQRFLLPADEFLGLHIQERWLNKLGVGLFHGLSNLLPPLRRVKTVLTLHHVGGLSDTATFWDRFYLSRLTDRSIRRAGAVIAVSAFSRSEALRQWNLAPEKVLAVLEGGPHPAFKMKDPASPPGPVPPPYILYVGSLLPHKNILTLIDAFYELRKAGLKSVPKLVLAGRLSPYAQTLLKRIEELRLAEEVRVLGGLSQDRILELYQNADLMVFPSLLEGFGFPVLEAMACGVPVIASNCAAIPEIAGGAALLFEPMDAAALARLMRQVLEDGALAGELRRKGLRRIKDFSWEKTARETLDVYRQLLKA